VAQRRCVWMRNRQSPFGGPSRRRFGRVSLGIVDNGMSSTPRSCYEALMSNSRKSVKRFSVRNCAISNSWSNSLFQWNS